VLDLGTRDDHGRERAGREARLAKRLLDVERAARDVAGVLEHAGVARHQGRGREPEDLPIGEVPGHDRQYHAQRLVGDVAVRGGRRDVLVGQEPLGVLGIEVAGPGAFLDLGLGVADRLAHLAGGIEAETRLVGPQVGSGALHQGGPVGEAAPAPLTLGSHGPVEGRVQLGLGVQGERLELGTGRGVDGIDGLRLCGNHVSILPHPAAKTPPCTCLAPWENVGLRSG